MNSPRSMVLSVCASLAALAALALSAQAAPLTSASRSAIEVSSASNQGFQNTTSVKVGACTGCNAAAAVPFAGEIEAADAAGAQNAILRFAALSRINTSQDRFANQGISPALSAGFVMRRGRRGVDIVEF